MADLELPPIIENARALIQRIEEILNGLGNDECAVDDPEEKAKIQEAIASYNGGLADAQAFTQYAENLLAWGIPVLPTFEVPEAMVASLSKEHKATGEANKVFVPRVVASTVNVKFGDPVPKEEVSEPSPLTK